MESYEDFRLLQLCKKFTDDSIKSMNSTTIFNTLKRNKIKSIDDLKKISKYKLILFHGLGVKRLSIVMQMKNYLDTLEGVFE